MRLRESGQVLPSRLSLEQALAQYLTAVRPSLAYGTWKLRERQLRLHVLPRLGRVRLVELTPLQVQAALNQIAQRRPCLANKVRETLAIALNWAIAQRWLALNPVRGTRPALYEPDPSPELAPADRRRLIGALRGHRFEALFLTQIGTGLRLGELLGLAWADVDLEGDPPLVRVRRQLRRAAGGAEIVPTLKSRKARREVPIPPIAVQALLAHRARQALSRDLAGPLWVEEDLVFATSTGRCLSHSTVERDFKKLVLRAGLPETLTPHDLRHLAATIWHERLPTLVVQDLLGHENVAMTGRYARTTTGQRRAAAAALEAALDESPASDEG